MRKNVPHFIGERAARPCGAAAHAQHCGGAAGAPFAPRSLWRRADAGRGGGAPRRTPHARADDRGGGMPLRGDGRGIRRSARGANGARCGQNRPVCLFPHMCAGACRRLRACVGRKNAPSACGRICEAGHAGGYGRRIRQSARSAPPPRKKEGGRLGAARGGKTERYTAGCAAAAARRQPQLRQVYAVQRPHGRARENGQLARRHGRRAGARGTAVRRARGGVRPARHLFAGAVQFRGEDRPPRDPFGRVRPHGVRGGGAHAAPRAVARKRGARARQAGGARRHHGGPSAKAGRAAERARALRAAGRACFSALRAPPPRPCPPARFFSGTARIRPFGGG